MTDNSILRGPGRNFSVNEATRRRNPPLFGRMPQEASGADNAPSGRWATSRLAAGLPAQVGTPLAPSVAAATIVQGVSREIEQLHNPIIAWCRAQVPQVPFIHSRPDKATGSTLGAPDFVICYRGKILMIELKTETGKLSKDQRIWHHLAKLQGVEVLTLRDMASFYKAVA